MQGAFYFAMESNVMDLCGWLHQENDKEGLLLMDCSALCFTKCSTAVSNKAWKEVELAAKSDFPVVTIRAKIRGNVLGLWDCELCEPGNDSLSLIGCLVLEKVVVEVSDEIANLPYSFSLLAPDSEQCFGRFSAFSEEERYCWIRLISGASQELVQARISNIALALFNKDMAGREISHEAPQIMNDLASGLFVNRYTRAFEFPASSTSFAFEEKRSTGCEEWLYESKFTVVVPHLLLKLYISWSKTLKQDIEKFCSTSGAAYLQAVSQAHIQHISGNIKGYQRSCDFLENYSGPYFRQSTRRNSKQYLFMPTNLHLQRFYILQHEAQAFNFLTSGACSAVALRFEDGGCRKIADRLIQELRSPPDRLNGCSDELFWQRCLILDRVGKQLRTMCNFVDAKANWCHDTFHLSKLQDILLDLKDILAALNEFVDSFPGIETAVDVVIAAFSSKGLADGLACNNHNADTDSEVLSGLFEPERLDVLQVDAEAFQTSLTTKIDSLQKAESEDHGAEILTAWISDIRNAARRNLQVVEQLRMTLVQAQLVRFILALTAQPSAGGSLHLTSADSNTLRLFYALQYRRDVVLSHALSVLCTGLMCDLWLMEDSQKHVQKSADSTRGWHALGPVFTILSYLSCYGDEKGMIEDIAEAWRLVKSLCRFKLIRAFSALKCPECVPLIEGSRAGLLVSLPVPDKVFQLLSAPLQEGRCFRVHPVFVNVGINHEATFAQTLGGAGLQTEVNREAVISLENYLEKRVELGSADFGGVSAEAGLKTAETAIAKFRRFVDKDAKYQASKNVKILRLAAEATRGLGGFISFCCKSGKDRTSMGVTLEEAHLLRETAGVPEHRFLDTLMELRRNGVRRENCRKNIGVPQYAFSPFQIPFLPEEYRPPQGTYNMLQT